MSNNFIGYPLTPSLAYEIGYFDGYMWPTEIFDANQNWLNVYNIYHCSGRREGSKKEIGYLSISKSNVENESIHLNIIEKIFTVDNFQNTVEANVDCLNDFLTTPNQWTLASRIIESNKEILDLTFEEKSKIEANKLIVKKNQKEIITDIPQIITSNWSIINSLQNQFVERLPHSFDVLEDLRKLKTNHKIYNQGIDVLNYAGNRHELQHFCRIGNGILPFNYWINSKGRILMMSTHNRLYLLQS